MRSEKTELLLVAVAGFECEMGSVYTADIAKYYPLGFETFTLDEVKNLVTEKDYNYLASVHKDYTPGGKWNKIKKAKVS